MTVIYSLSATAKHRSHLLSFITDRHTGVIANRHTDSQTHRHANSQIHRNKDTRTHILLIWWGKNHEMGPCPR